MHAWEHVPQQPSHCASRVARTWRYFYEVDCLASSIELDITGWMGIGFNSERRMSGADLYQMPQSMR